MVETKESIAIKVAHPIFLLPGMLEELKNEGEYGPALSGMLASLCGERCGVCQGVGHNAKRCPILKAMDSMTKESKTLKKMWGFFKGTRKNGGKQAFIARASEISLKNSIAFSKANLATKLIAK